MSPGESSSRLREVEALFHEAMEVPPSEREAFLRRRAGDDQALLEEAISLLALADDTSGGFLETPLTLAGFPGALLDDDTGDPSLGSYRLLRVLGEGGMGVVYLAEQQSPRRTVAIKVIRAALMSDAARKRFAHEAQALGRLHHPGVAQIHEARLDEARPFFVMEYVEGEPLGVYASRHGLSMTDRLALVAEIADAVQHAHERGIVHRDLKPGNILVTEDGRPKVLDFGVSRLVDDDLRLNTLRTEAGQLLGTVAYMSPEQASGDPASVDARTDVYSLGVIAFELLAGRLPFDLAGRSLPDAMRVVTQTEPASLSSIERSLRGDVETVVRTAMERSSTRRYSSAAAFADDIRRILRDEPIRARPPTVAYQFRKFAARNRGLVAGLLAVFVALAIGMAGTSIGMIRAVASERRARIAAASEESARIDAEREAETARAINDFLVEDLLSAAAPFRRGPEVRVIDVLDDAAASADALALRPLVLAEVRATLGEAYLALERFDAAREQLRLARDLRAMHLGAQHARTLAVEGALARVEVMTGHGEEGLAALRKVAAAQQSLLGDNHPDTLETVSDIGATLARLGRFEEALPVSRDVAIRRVAVLGEDARDAIISMRNAGQTAISLGDFEEADEWITRAERAIKRSGNDSHAELVYILDGRASLHLARDEPDKAVAILERAVEVARSAFGDDTATVGVTLVNLGNACVRAGDRPRAREIYEQAASILRARLGDDHDWTMMAVDNLAEATARLGDPATAAAMLEENIERRRRVLGNDHPSIAYSLASMAMAFASRGDWTGAADHFERAAEVHRASAGERSEPYVSALSNLAFCLFRAGEYARAEPLQEAVLAVERARSSPEGGQLWSDLRMLARIRLAMGDGAGAADVVSEMRTLQATDPAVVSRRRRVADALEARANILSGDSAPALDALAAATEALLREDGANDDAAEAVRALAATLRRAGREGDAAAWESRLADEPGG